jgi:Zn-dependent protease
MNSLESSRRCEACGSELPLLALVCDKCRTLVHSERLARISHRAQKLEQEGNLQQARVEWGQALQLLPSNATQADWIRKHLQQLDTTLSSAAAEPPKSKWVQKLGPLGPILVLLAKSKFLLTAIFKLKFLLSFFAFAGLYWSLYGAKFGVGFAVLILLHEFGHYVEIRRRGLPAEMPVFLPGLGAYVQWNAMGVSRATRAVVSLAGPIAGLIGACVCFYLWRTTGAGVWAALARSSAWLNILNLIPVWILDGNQAMNALSKLERWVMLCLCLLLWIGLAESSLFLVGAGVVYRLFTKDLPPLPAPRITAYYAFVLIALATLLHFVPGQMFSRR